MCPRNRHYYSCATSARGEAAREDACQLGGSQVILLLFQHYLVWTVAHDSHHEFGKDRVSYVQVGRGTGLTLPHTLTSGGCCILQ